MKMQLQTKVEIKKNHLINPKSSFLLLGSCFAENIGRNLLDLHFTGEKNPFGILFNPASISYALRRIIDEKLFDEKELIEHNGLWHSMFHHGEFSFSAKETVLKKINSKIISAKNLLPQIDFLIITFGSSQIYLYNGQIVANCHKLPENLFERKMLDIEEIFDDYKDLFECLFAFNRHLRVILSVSPVRYLRDGAHRNSINKATLLLAAERLVEQFENVIYFPAYEILLDELRDYRFFADDMLHPSALGEEIIWQRFSDCFFSDETRKNAEKIQKMNKMLAHRPLHANSVEYEIFRNKLEDLKKNIS
jgi:hypothetical protein